MPTSSSIRKSIDKLREQIVNFLSDCFTKDLNNPYVSRLILLHGGPALTDRLDKMSMVELLRLFDATQKALTRYKDEQASIKTVRKKAKNEARAQKILQREALTLYIHGGWSQLYKTGAASYILLRGGHMLLRGGNRLMSTTQHAAPLEALKMALVKIPDGASVDVRTCSQYAAGVMTNWSPQKNLDLIDGIKEYIRNHRLNVSVRFVGKEAKDRYLNECSTYSNRLAGLDLNSEYLRYTRRAASGYKSART